MKKRKPRRRPGFSLVELLVVIAIIALLVSLLVVGAFAALRSARAAGVKIEVTGLARALEAYKQQYGSYPPDFSDPLTPNRGEVIREQIRRHMAGKFRYQFFDRSNPDGPFNDIPPSHRLATLDPAESLYFWLRGFSPAAKLPLRGTIDGRTPLPFNHDDQSRLIMPTNDGSGWILNDQADWTPLYDFDKTRFQDMDGDGWPEYVPKNVSGAPVVYYRNYENAFAFSLADQQNPTRPYMFPSPYYSAATSTGQIQGPNGRPVYVDANGKPTFAEPDKFQLICAGLDGLFGIGGGSYPSGVGYSPDDLDNATSFTSGNTLKDDMP